MPKDPPFSPDDLAVTTFFSPEYLDNNETLAEYLNASLEEGGTELLIDVLNNIALAKGINELARMSGFDRDRLCKSILHEEPVSTEMVSIILKSLSKKQATALKT